MQLLTLISGPFISNVYGAEHMYFLTFPKLFRVGSTSTCNQNLRIKHVIVHGSYSRPDTGRLGRPALLD